MRIKLADFLGYMIGALPIFVFFLGIKIITGEGFTWFYFFFYWDFMFAFMIFFSWLRDR